MGTQLNKLIHFKITGGNDTPYPLEGLMNFLEHEFNKSHINYDDLIKSGMVTYEALQYLFQTGKRRKLPMLISRKKVHGL